MTAEMARITSERLVGRYAELELLDALLERSRAERVVVLLSGEAGVGKSRLVAEVVARAGAGGHRALVGACAGAGGDALPLAWLADVRRSLADEPALRERLHVADGEADVARVCELALSAVETLAASGPLLLVCEDAHWADASTRHLLGFLARGIRFLPVCLLITHRSDELHRRHPLRRLVHELERLAAPERLELGPLGRDEVAELVEALAGAAPPDARVDEVVRLSGGTPFYVEELIAAGDRSERPDGLRELVLAHVAELPERHVRLLRHAAAAEKVLDDAVLADVLGEPLEEVRALLRELVDRGRLRTEDDRIVFRHALVQEALYDDLLPGERPAVHRAFAEALAERAPARAGEIAYHWWRAGDAARALPAAVEAGLAAERIGASGEARVQFERALDLWDGGGAASLSRSELVIRCARACAAAGDPERAIELLRRELVVAGESVELLVELAAQLFRAHREDARAIAERAVALAAPGTEAEAEALTTLALNAVADPERAAEALGLAERAVASAAGSRLHVQARAHQVLAVSRALQCDPRALAEIENAVRLADASASLQEMARSGLNRVFVLSMLGRREDALVLARAEIERARARGVYLTIGAFLESNLLSLLARSGAWDEAVARGQEVRDVLERHGVAHEILLGHALGLVLLRRGDPDAEAVVEGAYAAALGFGLLGESLARVGAARIEAAARDGRWDRVPETMAELLPRLLPALVHTAGELVAAAARAAEPPRADAVREWVDAFRAAVRGAAFSSTATDTWLRQADEELARLRGEATADGWAGIAARWERAGDPYGGAYARLRAAEAALAVPPARLASGRREAERVLAPAAAAAAQLGARPLAAEIAALARRAGLRLGAEAAPEPPTSVTPRPFDLTGRELEVLALLASGRSNGQIARQLFVTTKTVSTHVSHILRKLDAINRVEAATIAHRHGLAAGGGAGESA